MRLATLLLPGALLLGGSACGSSCETDAPLDYADADLWLCHPEVAPCEPPRTHVVAESGRITTTRAPVAVEPPVACFAVYPTVDMRLGPGLHHGTDNVEPARKWAVQHAAQLAEVCRLYVPVYRQVTIGTYVPPLGDRKETCFDNAFEDVEAAIDAFLAAEPTRGIVLFGHSQGAQHLSRLIRERFDTNPALRERLVVAWPLGWGLGVEEDRDVGGTSDEIPVCRTADEPGCLAGYRSLLDGARWPYTNELLEGDEQVCTHPAFPEGGEGMLAAFTSPVDRRILRLPDGLDAGPDDVVRWPGAFRARCGGPAAQRALAVTWARRDEPAFDLDSNDLRGASGTHRLDVDLGIADVVLDVARRAEAWATPVSDTSGD